MFSYQRAETRVWILADCGTTSEPNHMVAETVERIRLFFERNIALKNACSEFSNRPVPFVKNGRGQPEVGRRCAPFGLNFDFFSEVKAWVRSGNHAIVWIICHGHLSEDKRAWLTFWPELTGEPMTNILQRLSDVPIPGKTEPGLIWLITDACHVSLPDPALQLPSICVLTMPSDGQPVTFCDLSTVILERLENISIAECRFADFSHSVKDACRARGLPDSEWFLSARAQRLRLHATSTEVVPAAVYRADAFKGISMRFGSEGVSSVLVAGQTGTGRSYLVHHFAEHWIGETNRNIQCRVSGRVSGKEAETVAMALKMATLQFILGCRRHLGEAPNDELLYSLTRATNFDSNEFEKFLKINFLTQGIPVMLVVDDLDALVERSAASSSEERKSMAALLATLRELSFASESVDSKFYLLATARDEQNLKDSIRRIAGTSPFIPASTLELSNRLSDAEVERLCRTYGLDIRGDDKEKLRTLAIGSVEPLILKWTKSANP